jgi:hypothetical protein
MRSKNMFCCALEFRLTQGILNEGKTIFTKEEAYRELIRIYNAYRIDTSRSWFVLK